MLIMFRANNSVASERESNLSMWKRVYSLCQLYAAERSTSNSLLVMEAL